MMRIIVFLTAIIAVSQALPQFGALSGSIPDVSQFMSAGEELVSGAVSAATAAAGSASTAGGGGGGNEILGFIGGKNGLFKDGDIIGTVTKEIDDVKNMFHIDMSIFENIRLDQIFYLFLQFIGTLFGIPSLGGIGAAGASAVSGAVDAGMGAVTAGGRALQSLM